MDLLYDPIAIYSSTSTQGLISAMLIKQISILLLPDPNIHGLYSFESQVILLSCFESFYLILFEIS